MSRPIEEILPVIGAAALVDTIDPARRAGEVRRRIEIAESRRLKEELAAGSTNPPSDVLPPPSRDPIGAYEINADLGEPNPDEGKHISKYA